MRNVVVVVGLVLLAACNKADAPAGNATGSAAAGTGGVTAAAVAPKPVQLQPGNWAITTEIVSMDMPGAPAGMKDQMLATAKQSGAQKIEHCLTPEEAAKPPADMFAKGQQAAGCSTGRFSTAGGRIDLAMTCSPPQAQGTTVAMTMSGPMTPTSYELAMDQKITNAQMPGGGMTMKARMTGTRTGECKA